MLSIQNYMCDINEDLYKDFCNEFNVKDVSLATEDIRSLFDLPRSAWDHVLVFLTNKGRLLCLQPYLSDSECKEIFKGIKNCCILGKNRSFYYPGNTNLIIIYLDTILDRDYANMQDYLVNTYKYTRYFNISTCRFEIPCSIFISDQHLVNDMMWLLFSEELQKFGKDKRFHIYSEMIDNIPYMIVDVVSKF